VKLNVVCDAEGKTLQDLNTFSEWTELSTSTVCNKVYESKSYSGCALNPMDYIAPILKFTGAILIIAGIALVTYGSKFIFYALGFIIFLLVNGLVFGISYTVGLIDPVKFTDPETANFGAIIGIAVVGLVLGIAAGYFLTKLIKQWAFLILAGAGAGIVAFMLLGPIIKNTYANIGVTIVAVAVGAYFGSSDKIKNFVLSAGTSLIGAFLLARGIGVYAGGFPSLVGQSHSAEYENLDQSQKDAIDAELNTPAAYGYLVGMVVAAVGGTFLQLRVTCKEAQDPDDFMNDDFK